MKFQIKKEGRKFNNESNELTSFDKVQNVVKNMGLTYHNENIILVDCLRWIMNKRNMRKQNWTVPTGFFIFLLFFWTLSSIFVYRTITNCKWNKC